MLLDISNIARTYFSFYRLASLPYSLGKIIEHRFSPALITFAINVIASPSRDAPPILILSSFPLSPGAAQRGQYRFMTSEVYAIILFTRGYYSIARLLQLSESRLWYDPATDVGCKHHPV
jgi:hypothetical protein